jgi:hypothetical protein
MKWLGPIPTGLIVAGTALTPGAAVAGPIGAGDPGSPGARPAEEALAAPAAPAPRGEIKPAAAAQLSPKPDKVVRSPGIAFDGPMSLTHRNPAPYSTVPVTMMNSRLPGLGPTKPPSRNSGGTMLNSPISGKEN